MSGNKIIYFDSFGVEDTPKEVEKFIESKSIITNIYRIQVYNLIMCGYFCFLFIGFILKGKGFLDTNLFPSSDYENNNKIIIKYFP